MTILREAAQMALDALDSDNPDIQLRAATTLRAALAQGEQEPVAWGIANTRPTEKHPLMMVMLDKPEPSHLVVPLYTATPQREWVGLTDEELIDAADEAPYHTMVTAGDYIYILARAIEAKLKEKNNG